MLRRFGSMAGRSESSPFCRAVVAAMRNLYPESLADKSFDNTGLLLEAPHNPRAGLRNAVLLTIDLTRAVTDEAIAKKCGAIVTYHPIIFKGLKSITLANSQQNSLLRLAAHGISVYSPHTAVDAAPGGNADWLADIVTGQLDHAGHAMQDRRIATPVPATTVGEGLAYKLHTFPSSFDTRHKMLKLGHLPHSREAIVPNASMKGAGMGRIVRFERPRYLSDILEGLLTYLDIKIGSVGICAGSGGSLLNNLDVDLLLTGELSHHETLAAVESGRCVICLNHSNSERGFLGAVLKDQLLHELKSQWQAIQREGSTIEDNDTDMDAAPAGSELEVLVSEVDRDPLQTLVKAHEA